MRESKASRDYAASCDKLLEYLFFEGQYKKRCFIRDNFKKYEGYLDEYSDFFNSIRRLSYSHMLADPNDTFHPFFDEERQISERIGQIQIFYSCMCNSGMYSVYRNMIADYNFCSILYEQNSCNELICRFCMLSETYGLFINDIFSNYEIEGITSLDTQINDLGIYKPYPGISAMNNYFSHEEYSSMKAIRRKRFSNMVNKISSDNDLTRPEKSLASASLKISKANARYKKSYISRRIGLWIWDNCISPLNKNKIILKNAIDELHESNVGVSFGDEDFNRSMKRILNNAIKCIDKRSLVPFKE